MTVWMVIHEVDYEGYIMLEIFSSAEEAREYAAGYIDTIYLDREWLCITESKYTYQDSEVRIEPYKVDHKIGWWDKDEN